MASHNNAPSSSTTKPQHLRLALFWAGLGGLGTLAIFPYASSLAPSGDPLPVPTLVVAIVSTLQMGVLLIPLCWIGLRLGWALQLDTPFARAWVYRQRFPAISPLALKTALLVGIIGGIALIGLDLAFQPWMPPLTNLTALKIDLWKRLLASFYGGITEELLLRLFCMTFITWILWQVFQSHETHPDRWIFWVAIGSAALLFGLGHLPTAASVWPLTPVVILRTITLNAFLGIPFGFLYWKWGLEYAMIAHFCADIVLQGLSGNLS